VKNFQSRRIQNIEIQLEEEEIWMQLRHSLTQEIFNVWKMQFPLAISDNVRIFSILRTIFFFREKKNGDPNSVEVASVVMPLEMHQQMRYNWSEHRTGFKAARISNTPVTLQLVRHELYKYCLTFGPGGRQVVFRDAESWHTGTIALFDLDCAGESISLKRFILVTAGLSRRHLDLLSAVHPHASLLAFMSNDRIFLWDFASCK
jgi:hypothetical protein